MNKGYIQKAFKGSCEEHGPFIMQNRRKEEKTAYGQGDDPENIGLC